MTLESVRALLKEYDVRGQTQLGMTPENSYRIAYASAISADTTTSKLCVIGQDRRSSSPQLAEAACAGVVDAGLSVTDVGIVPTPVVHFASHELKAAASIMITASHNPAAYNGMKITLNNQPLYGDALQQLQHRLPEHAPQTSALTPDRILRDSRYQQSYLNGIREQTHLRRPLRVSIDSAEGTCCELAPKLLKSLGCSVWTVPSMLHPHEHRYGIDPAQPEFLVHLMDAVVKNRCDLGLAFDGDGDRLGVVDHQGRFVAADMLLCAFARDVLDQTPGATVIHDVKCSRKVRACVEEAQGVSFMCRTGHSIIRDTLAKQQAALAGEMSGHFYFADRWYGHDDALYAAARLCTLVAERDDPVALFDSLMNPHGSTELKMACPEPHDFVLKLHPQRHLLGGDQCLIDGIRADFPDGFALVRASNTLPQVIFRFEGDNDQALQEAKKRMARLTRKQFPSVSLPF